LFPGFGTVLNIATIVVGSAIGLLLGHRLPGRTRDTVTDALGLVTLLIGALSAVEVTSAVLSEVVGSSAPVLIVLGSLVLGGIVGSLIDIEARLVHLGDWLRVRLGGRAAGSSPETGAPAADHDHQARLRFLEGFLTASLVFCVGPLTILGSLSDGLGLGAEQLILKSVLDGFAAIAFAASLGIGVMASIVAVAVIQGALTLVGFLLGDFLSPAQLTAITATGGLLLVGLGIRLLQLKPVPVGNLLPALVVAPLLVPLVAVLR
jgi:uncharacterized membrane protein YqgA involved in biofilm formation